MPYKDPERQKKAQHDSYLRNKEAVRARSKYSKRTLIQDFNLWKESKPCLDCKKWYPYYVMHWDHVRGEKEFEICEAVRCGNKGRAAVLAELKKCDLVCGNCHATRTHLRRETKMDGAS